MITWHSVEAGSDRKCISLENPEHRTDFPPNKQPVIYTPYQIMHFNPQGIHAHMSDLLLRIKPAYQVICVLLTPHMLLEFLARNSHIGRFHINQTLVRSVSLLLLQHICSSSHPPLTI